MDVWFHNENPYPFVPREVLDRADSVRASLPNKYCDPKIAADLFEEVLDEFLLCDEHGLNVVAIEHHAGINSLFGANPLILGILARQTRKARILSLGTLISLRPDPVRIAEEYATADVISRGRLEIGYVKSGGSEMASNNANPVNNIERYWEAIDLVTKALTHQEGPFSWEGKHYTHRHVNIWPRPWQQPHPRMWAATGDPDTAGEVGRRSMVNVLVLRGPEGTRRAWAAYRRARDPQHVRMRARLARARRGRGGRLGTARQAEPVHLADHRVAGDAAKLPGDLTCGKAVGPQFLEQLDAFVSPAHASKSSAGRSGLVSAEYGSRPATMRCPTRTLTMYSETVPPHEMSHLTIEMLQYGQTQAQESLPPSPHLRSVPAPTSTISPDQCCSHDTGAHSYLAGTVLTATGAPIQ